MDNEIFSEKHQGLVLQDLKLGMLYMRFSSYQLIEHNAPVTGRVDLVLKQYRDST